MGTVHAGLRQGALGFRKRLAIKRLHSHLVDDPQFVARFKREIRLASQIHHPNVVQTVDVLENSGELALVMEHVEGVTLHHLIRQVLSRSDSFPIAIAVHTVAEVLHGLHAAHQVVDEEGHVIGLVHRDVSPQNIMVGTDGLVKLLDFGVATAESEAELTQAGSVAGKVGYMSPEQIRRESLDRRSDVFAAGVLLWEVLTGRRLFRRKGQTEMDVLRNVLTMPVPSPCETRTDVPPGVERAVMRALNRDPALRFPTAEDFAIALESAVQKPSAVAVAAWASQVTSAPNVLQGARPRNDTVRETSQDQATRNEVSRDAVATAVQVPAPALQPRTDSLRAAHRTLPPPDFQPHSGQRWLTALALVGGAAAMLLLSLNISSRVGAPTSGAEVRKERSATVSDRAPARVSPAKRPATRAPQLAQEQTKPKPKSALAEPAAAPAAKPTSAPTATPTSAAASAKPKPGSPGEAPQGIHPQQRPKGKPSVKSVVRPPGTVNSSPRPGCSPPVYTDGNGVRRFKPHCL